MSVLNVIVSHIFAEIEDSFNLIMKGASILWINKPMLLICVELLNSWIVSFAIMQK